MGGQGSGRHWHHGAKATTDGRCGLDVRQLKREGKLRSGYSGRLLWTHRGETISSIQMSAQPDRVVLLYKYRDGNADWKNQQCPVRIVYSACNFGGSRAWFLCPAVGCGRRVAILYAGEVFACRQCLRLVYASSREDAGDRAARRADRLRVLLGWEPGFLNGNGGKPNGMSWRAYIQLVTKHNKLTGQATEALARKFRFAGR